MPVIRDDLLAYITQALIMSWTWVLAAASLVATVLNIQHDRRCFAIWVVTNAAWTAVDWHKGIYSQAALQFVYFGLAIWGLVKWKRHEL